MLLDETTGSKGVIINGKVCNETRKRLTREVSANCGFHQSLHPLSNDYLFIMTEEMWLVRVMYDSESVTARVDVLVCHHFVPHYVDVAFNLSLL